MAALTPVQVARLAVQWYDANKADPIATIKHTAEQYAYTPEQVEQAIEQLWKIRPALMVDRLAKIAPPAAEQPEPFQLDSTPKPTFWKAPKQPKARQTVLFSGLDCLKGQTDLFEA